MKRTTLNLGPFGIYLWGAILAIGGMAFAGGASLTANSRGTIFPQQLANGSAVPGYVPVAGYCTDTATGTSAGTGTANGQCWKPMPSGMPTGTVGQEPVIVAGTETHTVAVTGSITSTGTGTYTYTMTVTGTQTQTATRTYTFTQYAGTSTVTATGTQTNTTSATMTQTGATTGTQTKTGTSSNSWTATGVGTSTGTDYKASWRPAESQLGSYYLIAVNDEGGTTAEAYKNDQLRALGVPGYITDKAYSANCSAGSDGLIGEFALASSSLQSGVGPVWAAGMWAAYLRASSTGPATIRVEVWEEAASQWFSFSTDSFNSPAPAIVYGSTMKEVKMPSSVSHDVYFLLYAVCSSAASVTWYADTQFSSRIDTPLHTYRMLASQIPHNSGTVESALADLESRIVSTRSVFVQAFEFANQQSLTSSSRGSLTTYARYITFPDGLDRGLFSYFWRLPADYASGGYVTLRPLWIPLAADADWTHKVAWLANYAPVSTGDAAKAGTTIHWDGDTNYAHYGLTGFASTASILENGGQFTPAGADIIRLSIEREHSVGSDTYVGDVGFVGLQIDYASSL